MVFYMTYSKCLKQNNLTVSIVIPVYNEGDSLAACLEAINLMNVQPTEIIVVDNNSTDNSLAVACRFQGVTVLSAKDQGVLYARNIGFNAAKGDIIARIDADTVLPRDWLDKTLAIMQDDQLAAVSGSADYYDFKFRNQLNYLDRYFRRYIASKLKNRLFLHGSNMAIRRSAWQSIRACVCDNPSIHEDMDLAIHLQEEGFRVIYDEQLVAGISSRRISNNFKDFIQYTLVSPRTYATHDLKCQRYMYYVIVVCWLGYFPAHWIYLSYDYCEKSMSFRNYLFNRQKVNRSSPTINHLN